MLVWITCDSAGLLVEISEAGVRGPEFNPDSSVYLVPLWPQARHLTSLSFCFIHLYDGDKSCISLSILLKGLKTEYIASLHTYMFNEVLVVVYELLIFIYWGFFLHLSQP